MNYEALEKQWKPLLSRLVRARASLTSALGEDLEQEARIALWMVSQSYRPERGAFGPYLKLVVQRRLSNYLRHEFQAEVLSLELLEEGGVEFSDCKSLSPEQAIIEKEALQKGPEENISPGHAAFGEYLRLFAPIPPVRALARRCGVGAATVRSWWRGDRQPQHLDDLRDIAEVIERPLEELIAVYRRRG